MKKEEKDTVKEEFDKSTLNGRLDNLFGKAAPKKKKEELNEEETKNIRKKMVFCIWIIGIFFGLMVFKTYNPFHKAESVPFEEIETQTQEIIPNGTVEINNKKIVEINSIFNINDNNPLYDPHILNLYAGGVTVDDLDFKTQMLLLTSTEEFNSFMFFSTNLKKFNPNEEYNHTITFTTEEVKNIAKKFFGENVNLKYENFIYSFKYTDELTIYFEAVLTEDTYTLNKIEKIESNVKVYSKLVYAEKFDEVYYLSYNVLFGNKDGIYSDKELTKKVSNNVSDVEKYIDTAKIYTFIFGENAIGNELFYTLKEIR